VAWRPVREAMGCPQGRNGPGLSGRSGVWIKVTLGDHLQWVYLTTPHRLKVVDRSCVMFLPLGEQWVREGHVRGLDWEKKVECLCGGQDLTFRMRSQRHRHRPAVNPRHVPKDFWHQIVLDLIRLDHLREQSGPDGINSLVRFGLCRQF